MEETNIKTKYCKFCGEKIPEDAVVCIHCGRQVEELKTNNAGQQPQVIINNNNANSNTNSNVNNNSAAGGRDAKDKWVALLLCFFLGVFGAHKFYEGKVLLGFVYLFTMGLFGIGVLVDFIVLLFKPNPYYV